jgi:hypothetical protein
MTTTVTATTMKGKEAPGMTEVPTAKMIITPAEWAGTMDMTEEVATTAVTERAAGVGGRATTPTEAEAETG